jgi:hypothetical protein
VQGSKRGRSSAVGRYVFVQAGALEEPQNQFHTSTGVLPTITLP